MLLVFAEPCVELDRGEPLQRDFSDTGREMQADGLFVRGPRPRAETCPFLVQPSSQELGHRLPFIRQRRPLLHVPEHPCELVCDLPPRPTVDRFPAPLTFLPSEIRPSDPSAIGTLGDAAL